MKWFAPVFLFLLIAAVELPANPLRVHMLSGSEEYKSEASLLEWGRHLQKAYGVQSTFSLANDHADSVEGLENLNQADALIVFCRRWELNDQQAALIKSFIRSGKPVLAIRTASHAFQFYKEFDREILGGDYQGHGEGGEPMTVFPCNDLLNHPALRGVSGWDRTGKVYRNPNLAEDVHVLLSDKLDCKGAPLAWVRTNRKQRIFYTSMGFPQDFAQPMFITLLDNALFWICRMAPDCKLPLP